MAVGHVADEFVMICRPLRRSYHALLRMPWWPGRRPVRIDVWFASVTVGSPAIAPCVYAVPMSSRRATFGASPAAAIAYSTLGLVPSQRNPTTCRGRPPARSRTSSRTSPSWPWTYDPSSAGARPSSSATVGATSTSRPARGTSPSARTPFAGDDEGRPGLHHVERAVLAAMPALVLPVVGGGVDHAQVGRGRVVEELGDLREPERVRVLAARGVGVSALGVQPGEPVRRLVGERVGALAGDLLVAAALGAPEADPPVVRAGLVRRVAREQDHVDDRVERGVEQDLERPLGVVDAFGGDLVDRDCDSRGSRHTLEGYRFRPRLSRLPRTGVTSSFLCVPSVPSPATSSAPGT